MLPEAPGISRVSEVSGAPIYQDVRAYVGHTMLIFPACLAMDIRGPYSRGATFFFLISMPKQTFAKFGVFIRDVNVW